MPWPTPPQGWEMVTGTWGTDADRDETLAQSGAYSLNLLDTTVATKVRSPWISVDTDLRAYISLLLRADSIAAGNVVTITIEEYAADRVTLVNDTAFSSAVLSAADAWEWVSGELPTFSSAVKWRRVTIAKAANAYNVYIDNVIHERVQPGWSLVRATTQAIPTGTWTTVLFDTDWTNPKQRCTLASGIISPQVSGAYAITTAVEFEAVSDGTELAIRILTGTNRHHGQKLSAGGAHTMRLTAHTIEKLGSFGSILVQVWHNEGSNVNVTPRNGIEGYTRFAGYKFGKM